MWRCVPFWKTSRIFSRGRVAFRPLFFSSSTLVMGRLRALASAARSCAKGQPLESMDHIEVASANPARSPESPMSLIIRRGLQAGLLAFIGILGACSSLQSSDNFLGVITPYRVEVVQGNVVTREMAAAVKPGMSRTQLRDILGSPLLTDIFHADRWDYMFASRRSGAEPQARRVTAIFEGENLVKLEAGELPR